MDKIPDSDREKGKFETIDLIIDKIIKLLNGLIVMNSKNNGCFFESHLIN